ncbi:MAG: hypothetical protein ABI451_13230 [Dokdonella sp.]
MSTTLTQRVIDTRCLSPVATSRSSLIGPIGLTGLIGMALFAAQSATAIDIPRTIHVGPINGPGSSCAYTTIQAAINAASTTVSDTITIDSGLTYSAQHLTIANKSLTLQGAACSGGIGNSPEADPRVTLTGNTNASSAVINISGTSTVTLLNLNITGNTSSGDGGGISYAGTGTLTLTNVQVNANTAGYGGGINFKGLGGVASLVLGTDGQVLNNTAQVSGGGLRIDGSGTLSVRASGNLIYNNHACPLQACGGTNTGYGGGIELVGTTAIIDSPGSAGLPVIWKNDANYGGGIAVLAVDPNSAQADIGASDPNFPVRIEDNFASHTGGGIYLKPDSSPGGVTDYAQLFAHSFRIDHNAAVEGSAIYGDSHTYVFFPIGAIVTLTHGNCSGLTCDTIDRNTTEDSNGQPTAGSTILLQDSDLYATGVHMRGNVGAHAVREVGSSGILTLADCLLAENQMTAELIAGDDATVDIDQCTLANDAVGAAQVISANSDLMLTNSILGEAGTAALSHTGGSLMVQNIVALNTGGLPSSPNIVQANPLFFDVTHSDYRLRVQTDGVTSTESPAVDFAPTTGNELPTDIDGRARVADVVFLVNRFGPKDLGAYEMQPITDRIFSSRMGDAIQLVQ